MNKDNSEKKTKRIWMAVKRAETFQDKRKKRLRTRAAQSKSALKE